MACQKSRCLTPLPPSILSASPLTPAHRSKLLLLVHIITTITIIMPFTPIRLTTTITT